MAYRTEILLAWLKRGYRCDIDKAAEKWGWTVRQYQRAIAQLKVGGYMIDSDAKFSKIRGRPIASHQLIRGR